MAKAPSKTRAKKAAEQPTTTTVQSAKLKSFTQRDPDHPELSFTRYWWLGEGPREGIEPWVRKKMRPGDDPDFGWAAKMEVLLPAHAPSVYANINFLLQRFDAVPPFDCHAMVQVKIALSDAEPWHAAYESVRGYARAHFAVRFPTILVAHVPAVAGLTGFGNHIHCIALSRPLNINGLGGADHHLCSDRGYADALQAWKIHTSDLEAGA
jgi:hypothetical protein